MFAGFRLTFSSAATNFGCIDSFLSLNSRNEEMMGDGSFARSLPLYLNSKRLLSSIRGWQGHSGSE